MVTLLKQESLWIPVILHILLMGCWSELDLYAPSFPQMMHHFGTTEQIMQWTLSLNFLGFFIASLLCGPLADAFGRRRVILLGSLIFVAGSTICLFAPTMSWMLFGRLIQGIGVSAPVTVCMAVVADIYQGERQVKLLSKMNSSVTVVMALAPIVGVYLTDHFGWHANFVAIFAMALLGTILVGLFVPETHEHHVRTKFAPSTLMSNYWTLLKSRDFMSATLGLCLSITPYFILIGVLPLLFMEALGVSIDNYAFYQGSIVGLFSVLSLCIPFLLNRFDSRMITLVSLALSFGALALAFLLSLMVPDNPLLITFLMWIYVAGIVVPPTMMFASAMDMFPKLRASASSLIQSMRMLSMSLGTALAGMFYDGTFMPVVVVMLFFMTLSIPMTLMAFRRKALMPLTTQTLSATH